jgi:hypothetical protein
LADKIIEAAKRAAIGAINASGPVALAYGKVKSVKPFEIDIDQKLTLTEEFIVVGQHVKEYSLDFTIDGEMWHGFRKDDEVLLSRMQGGQRYVVIDWLKRVDEDTRPAQVMAGEVVSAAPSVKINDYLTLGPSQLILTRNVTDYYVDMSVSHETEPETKHVHPVIDTYTGGGASSPTSHSHGFKSRKRFLVHNGLAVGDKVLLVCDRVQRRWHVVDFITRSGSAVNGEWV